jgi:DNA repair protein RadB
VPLKTGCRALDELLGGGFEGGCLTVLFGEGGSGKTNVCLQLSRNVVLDGKKVIYIDTEGVSAVRLRQIAGDRYEDVAPNILFSEPFTHEEQEQLVEKAIRMAEASEEIGLVVLDSATMHYRLAMAGPDWDEERRSFNRQLARLLRLARRRDIPVILTSQVYTDIEKGTFEPLGGHPLTHNAKTLLRLEKAGPNLRRAVIVKHRHIPEGSGAKFRLTDRGVED